MSRINTTNPDIVLIGAGIMSATLGVLLKELNPSFTIEVIERLDSVALESSDAWNNAGTGHSAFCELNYTPEKEDGSISIKKAIQIAAQFEISKEFWASLLEKKYITDPAAFITPVPHISFVWGQQNTSFLRKRFEAMQQHHLFEGMQYAEDAKTLGSWMPLIMEGRDASQPCAATKMDAGTDVNFGALTRKLFRYLFNLPGITFRLAHEVRDLQKDSEGNWSIEVKNLTTDKTIEIKTPFIFIGAGGGSLPLLEKSGIPESRGYGGFPVSGQWLICNNQEQIARHHAKVYGKASVGAPPMSVPHLDTRMIDGKQSLLFGPYAGFSTKFLKHGSFWDLPGSIKFSNIKPMIMAGMHNLSLTRYLIEQVSQSGTDRLQALQEYMPTAKLEDWTLETAGQRVQVIKKNEQEGGVLEFGTELVSAADGSIAALLGASPGASTAVAIMLEMLQRCFPEQLATTAWQNKLKEIIPSYGQSLAENAALGTATRRRTSEVLFP
jgi:malate dehydrogenase (quinone)